MKILVIQLARLGDGFLTWPAIRALSRKYPNAEIHVLCRKKYEAAFNGLLQVKQIHHFPTSDLIQPIISKSKIDSENILNNFMNELDGLNFDLIINYTFSPLSSYITHFLQAQNNTILGYTRHSDGYFNVSDEISAYFYAQIGPKGFNRYHLADLFASMVGMDLIPSDWSPAVFEAETKLDLPSRYIAIQVGASEEHKAIPPFKVAQIIKAIFEYDKNFSFVLIGSADEINKARAIQSNLMGVKIIDLVGLTEIAELHSIIKRSRFLISPDSVSQHIASLTNTPVINISLGKVNFWETGPRSEFSKIYVPENVDQIKISEMISLVKSVISKSGTSLNNCYDVISQNGITFYQKKMETNDFAWNLLQAIYLGETRPTCEDIKFYEVVLQMYEVNNIAIQQLKAISHVGLKKVSPILDRSNEVIIMLGKIKPELSIITNWYSTEKIRIPPSSEKDLVIEELRIHQMLKNLLRSYIPDDVLVEVENGKI